MAARNFDKALPRILVYEGGFSDHPRDPGGATNFGVTQRVYDGYHIRQGLPIRSVRSITRAEVNIIYRIQYWDAIKGDALPAGLDFVMFDGAVNSGSAQSVKWLQRALREEGLYTGAIDGDISEATLAAVKQHPDHDLLIADILARRLGMLQHLKTWPDFGRGWTKRVSSVRAIGQSWAMGSVGPQPTRDVALAGGNAKGYAGDVAMALLSQESGTNTAAGGTGLAAIVTAAQQSIGDYVSLSKWIAYLFVGLTIIGALVAIGGAISAFVSSRQNKRAQRAIDGDVLADLPPREIEPASRPRKSSARRTSSQPKSKSRKLKHAEA